MNFRTTIISAIFPAMSLNARDKTDVMVMKNGDRMTARQAFPEATEPVQGSVGALV